MCGSVSFSFFLALWFYFLRDLFSLYPPPPFSCLLLPTSLLFLDIRDAVARTTTVHPASVLYIYLPTLVSEGRLQKFLSPPSASCLPIVPGILSRNSFCFFLSFLLLPFSRWKRRMLDDRLMIGKMSFRFFAPTSASCKFLSLLVAFAIRI